MKIVHILTLSTLYVAACSGELDDTAAAGTSGAAGAPAMIVAVAPAELEPAYDADTAFPPAMSVRRAPELSVKPRFRAPSAPELSVGPHLRAPELSVEPSFRAPSTPILQVPKDARPRLLRRFRPTPAPVPLNKPRPCTACNLSAAPGVGAL